MQRGAAMRKDVAMNGPATKFASRLRGWLWQGQLLLWTVAIWSMSSPLALAAKKKAAEVKEEKSYVFPYFIVMVGLALGLMAICRPSSRADRADDKKTDEDDE